ncbi:AAC(3) family N-acetyltransferase [Streptomyces sp. SID13031]|nr:AAC(3) family N-acetyltransferase [Streptomyces sp. SID13031]
MTRSKIAQGLREAGVVSFTAVGPAASRLLSAPDDIDPWGEAGPLGQLTEADGQVLLLGAPLDTLTLCHHAEAIADVPGKRRRGNPLEDRPRGRPPLRRPPHRRRRHEVPQKPLLRVLSPQLRDTRNPVAWRKRC